MHLSRSARAGRFKNGKSLKETWLNGCEIQIWKNWRLFNPHQFSQRIQARALNPEPIKLPRICRMCLILMRMPTGYPVETARGNLVDPTCYAGATFSAQAVNQFMAGQRFAFDMVRFVCHQVPSPHSCVQGTSQSVSLSMKIAAKK